MKDIKGFEGRYAVTEDGKIWSYPNRRNKFKGAWLKPNKFKITSQRNKPRYILRVQLYNKNKKKSAVQIHRLVAMTFIDNPDNKEIVNHKDGNPLNPHKDNLEWVTNKENSDHAFRIGLMEKPLSSDEIVTIRDMCKRYNYKDVGAMLNINKHTVWDIKNNRRYADIV